MNTLQTFVHAKNGQRKSEKRSPLARSLNGKRLTEKGKIKDILRTHIFSWVDGAYDSRRRLFLLNVVHFNYQQSLFVEVVKHLDDSNVKRNTFLYH